MTTPSAITPRNSPSLSARNLDNAGPSRTATSVQNGGPLVARRGTSQQQISARPSNESLIALYVDQDYGSVLDYYAGSTGSTRSGSATVVDDPIEEPQQGQRNPVMDVPGLQQKIFTLVEESERAFVDWPSSGFGGLQVGRVLWDISPPPQGLTAAELQAHVNEHTAHYGANEAAMLEPDMAHFRHFIQVIPQMESNNDSRADCQLAAISIARTLYKALTFSPEQRNSLVIDLAQILHNALAPAPNVPALRSARHSNTVRAEFSTERSRGSSFLSATRTALARGFKQEKTTNKTLKFLNTVIRDIPQRGLAAEAFEAAKQALLSAPGSGSWKFQELYLALLRRCEPGQRLQLNDAVYHEADGRLSHFLRLGWG